MTRVSRNITANLLANLWGIALSIAVVPWVLRYLGPEAYGLIGFFTSLTALLAFLDLGLGASVAREMARLSAHDDAAQLARDTARTFEVFYWGVGVVSATLVVVLAPWIGDHWLNVRSLSRTSVYYALICMGLVVALQWPMSFYFNALMGRQQQVAANRVQVSCLTVRSLGVLVVMAMISPTVPAYFLWHAGVYLVQTGLLAHALSRSLPLAAGRALPRLELLRPQLRFSTQMMAGYILATVCVQLDRILIAGMFTLDMLGFYSIAVSLTTLLPALVTPVFSALFPRFVQLVAQNDQLGLVRALHDGSQGLSVIAIPAAIVGALFSREILILWTGSPLVAEQTGTILTLLFVGAGLNGLMHVPYAILLARGEARLYVVANLVSVVVLGPLLFVLCRHFGSAGAAWGSILYNGGFVLFVARRIFSGYLRTERRKWYVNDVAVPLTAGLLVAALLKVTTEVPSSRLGTLGIVALATVATFGATLAAAPLTRSHVARLWREREQGRGPV